MRVLAISLHLYVENDAMKRWRRGIQERQDYFLGTHYFYLTYFGSCIVSGNVLAGVITLII